MVRLAIVGTGSRIAWINEGMKAPKESRKEGNDWIICIFPIFFIDGTKFNDYYLINIKSYFGSTYIIEFVLEFLYLNKMLTKN